MGVTQEAHYNCQILKNETNMPYAEHSTHFENTEMIPCTSSFSLFDQVIKKSSTHRPLRYLETVLSFAQKFEMENLIASKFSTTTTDGQGHMADWG